jgi:hypothetical protein
MLISLIILYKDTIPTSKAIAIPIGDDLCYCSMQDRDSVCRFPPAATRFPTGFQQFPAEGAQFANFPSNFIFLASNWFEN